MQPTARSFATVLGLILVLAGAVWIAQGLNLPFAPRSFMTSDRTWLVIGAVVVLGGMVLAGWGWRGRQGGRGGRT